jgi:hypothetical protein
VINYMRTCHTAEPRLDRVVPGKAFFAVGLAYISLACVPVGAADEAPANTVMTSSGKAVSRKQLREAHPYKLGPNAPMWQRYLAAGEEAHRKGDDATAKRCYFEALSQLERAHKTSPTVTAPYARLQRTILDLYPNYPSDAPKAEGEKQIAIDKEEIDVLTRLSRLNQYYRSPTGSLAATVTTQIQFAQTDLKKNQETLESKAKNPQ